MPVALARPVPRRFRVARAYAAALRVALSYAWASAVARVRGPAWLAATQPARHRRNGRRVRDAILRLRGLYIKVGQLASALTNVLPEAFRAELEGMQDAVPAGPGAHVRARIAAELGGTPEALFATFEAAPVASASLAQVHRATLADGRAVAVKVQHADIEEVARLDLHAIGRIARVASRWFGLPDPTPQLAEVEAVVEGELDFRQEADAGEAFGARLGGRRGLAVPDVVRERSAARVLTTAWADGLKVGDLAALDAAGIDRRALAARIVDAYGQMIFRDGVYHADPHPGNLVATPAPGGGVTLTFLDWGATARLTPEMQRGLAEFLMGTLRRDAARVTRALVAMGFVPTAGDDGTAGEVGTPPAVLALVERIHARVLHDLDPSRFRLADLSVGFALETHRGTRADLDELGLSFRDLTTAFRVPRDWILLERTALLVLGVCTALDPDLNPFARLWPFVRPLVDERELVATAGGTVLDRLAGDVRAWWQTVESALAPVPAETVALRAEVARLSAETARLAADRSAVDGAAQRVERAARQVSLAVGATGAGGVAYVAHAAGDALWAGGAFAVAAVCGLALAAGRRSAPR